MHGTGRQFILNLHVFELTLIGTIDRARVASFHSGSLQRPTRRMTMRESITACHDFHVAHATPTTAPRAVR